MKLIDRYILGQFSKNLALVICSLMTIYLLVDFFEKVDNFLEAKKTVGLTIKYLFLKIPLIYDQLIPVCILLAGVITLGVLNHNRELMAMKAAGISVGRIIAPILAGALFFIFLTLIMAQWLLPPTVAETNRIWFEEVKNVHAQGIIRSGRVFHRGKHGIYSFRRLTPQDNVFADFSYAAWDKEFRLSKLITVKKASYTDDIWHLKDGQIKKPGPGDSYVIETFASRNFNLPETPADFFLPVYKIDEQSISQLVKKAIHADKDDTIAWRDLHRRLSYIFLALPLILLGLPTLLIITQRWGKDLSLAIPISCGMAFAAWGWWSTAQSMIKAYSLNPALASWSIHIVIGGIGLFMIRRQDG